MDSKYGFVVTDSDGDDIGDVIDLTNELRQNPILLKEKVDEVIKGYEDSKKEEEEED